MFQERYYQTEAVNSIYEYFNEKAGNPLVVLPTGTGKSVVIAQFIHQVLLTWPTQRFLIATHVKELVKQNAEKMQAIWPLAPIGINSAGLKQRDYTSPILFCNVQSIAKSAKKIGHVDLMIIDEAHLLSPNDNTQYQRLINDLKEINPFLKVIGFTATPYRLGQGMLTEGGLFTDICYDISGVQAFNRLIEEGYLAPLVPKQTTTNVNIQDVGISSTGDYNINELEDETDKILLPALQELLEFGKNRKSWLIFTSGIKTAERAEQILKSFGIPCAAVHSKKPAHENDHNINSFKTGWTRALINFGKLTTGFDHPSIDLIGMLRATTSPGLWVQMLGRGTRPAKGKINCLVLDFAGNTARLGPINDPRIPKKRGKGTGEAPIKICPECEIFNHASARYCGGQPFPNAAGCGFEFKFNSKIKEQADTRELIKSHLPMIVEFDVDQIKYTAYSRPFKPTIFKVTYYAGPQKFDEFICLEHSGYALKQARCWWKRRHEGNPPVSVHEALEIAKELKIPKKINVWTNTKYPKIMNYEF